MQFGQFLVFCSSIHGALRAPPCVQLGEGAVALAPCPMKSGPLLSGPNEACHVLLVRLKLAFTLSRYAAS